jgi:hypothetical protein
MALTPAIDAAKLAFARKHALRPDDPRTLEAFFTHQVLIHRNMTEFAAEQSWKGERKILTGGDGDIQIDAVAVVVNGEVVRSIDDLDDLERAISEDEPVAVSFVFVQATGRPLAGDRLAAKISGFSDGVFAVLDHDGKDSFGINPGIMEWIAIKNRIFEILDENEIEGCCECAMYLVWGRKISVADGNVKRAITTAEGKIRRNAAIAGRFNAIKFVPIDSDRLEDIIRAVDHHVVVSLKSFVEVPTFPKAKACYLGYFRADHLLEMITVDPDDGTPPEIRSSFFASNVRSYLGIGSRVNAAIAETLRNDKERPQFALRSNGIAIVAKDVEELTGDLVRLKFAQIVNGCQTSHTLFDHRELLKGPAGKQVFVPVKIIVTGDSDIANAVVLALNRQTPVEETQVVTEREVVDRIASTFASPLAPRANRAYFERRVNEFKDKRDETDKGEIDKNKVITLYDLARAYAASFLPRPEQLSVQGKQPVINQISRGIIFNKDQAVEPYHVAGLMILRAREALIRDKKSKKWDRYPAKNQLLFAMRVLLARAAGIGDPPADMGSPEAHAYVQKLAGVLADPARAGRIADIAVRCVWEAVGGGGHFNSKLASKPATTEAVRKKAMAAPL